MADDMGQVPSYLSAFRHHQHHDDQQPHDLGVRSRWRLTVVEDLRPGASYLGATAEFPDFDDGARRHLRLYLPRLEQVCPCPCPSKG